MKSDNHKVGLIIGTIILIVLGIWIFIVGCYVISNAQLRDVDEIKALPVFLIACALVAIFMMCRCSNDKKDNKNPE